MRCFVCKGPYHPATGGLHDNGKGGLTPFCGVCERDALDFVKWQHRRRWKADGKRISFYDHVVCNYPADRNTTKHSKPDEGSP